MEFSNNKRTCGNGMLFTTMISCYVPKLDSLDCFLPFDIFGRYDSNSLNLVIVSVKKFVLSATVACPENTKSLKSHAPKA